MRLTLAFIVMSLAALPAQPPKSAQTPAQKKIGSRLLRAIERARRGDAQQDAALQIDAKGRVLVEIRADVGEAIEKKLRDIDATIVATVPKYRSILAWVPLTELEGLAALEGVSSIQPAPKSTTNKRPEG